MTYWRNSSARLVFTWTRWLLLRHPSVQFVNVTLPTCSFIICAMALLLLPTFNVTKEFGLIQQANGLLQILAPFFVAALALIAGFPGDALDRPMGGSQPYLLVLGEKYLPSRREVLGYLFAYLAALSVLTYLGGGVIMAASESRYTACACLARDDAPRLCWRLPQGCVWRAASSPVHDDAVQDSTSLGIS